MTPYPISTPYLQHIVGGRCFKDHLVGLFSDPDTESSFAVHQQVSSGNYRYSEPLRGSRGAVEVHIDAGNTEYVLLDVHSHPSGCVTPSIAPLPWQGDCAALRMMYIEAQKLGITANPIMGIAAVAQGGIDMLLVQQTHDLTGKDLYELELSRHQLHAQRSPLVIASMLADTKLYRAAALRYNSAASAWAGLDALAQFSFVPELRISDPFDDVAAFIERLQARRQSREMHNERISLSTAAGR